MNEVQVLGGRVPVLHAEIQVLAQIDLLVEKERHALVERDIDGLLTISREKESLVRKLKKLHETYAEEPGGDCPQAGLIGDLSSRRRTLVERVRQKNLLNARLVRAHLEQVGTLLAFLKNASRACPVYDSRGRLGTG